MTGKIILLCILLFFSLASNASGQAFSINKEHVSNLQKQLFSEKDDDKACFILEQLAREYYKVYNTDSVKRYAEAMISRAASAGLLEREAAARLLYARASRINLNISRYNNERGQFYSNAQKALELYKKGGNKKGTAYSMIYLGSYYFRTSRFEEAAELYNQALSLASSIKDSTLISFVNTYLGEYYCNVRKDADNALLLFRRGYRYFKKTNDTLGIIILSMRYSYALQSKNMAGEQIRIMEEAASIVDKGENEFLKVDVFSDLANAYQKNGLTDKAIDISLKAIEIGNRVGTDFLISSVLSTIADAYAVKKMPEEEAKYLRLSKINGDLYHKRLNQEFVEVQKEMIESEKRKYEAELDNKKSQYRFTLIAIALFIVSGGLFGLYLFYRQTSRLNGMLEEKNRLIREQNVKLEQSNEELENRVVERTEQLNQTNLELIGEISRRIEAEEEIKKVNADLERRIAERTKDLAMSNAELESFSYSVSHDLKAPLRYINGYAHALKEETDGRLSESENRLVEKILNSASKMGWLIDSMLQLSRVTRHTIIKQKFPISEIAAKISAELKESEWGRKTQFIIQENILVECDKEQIAIALENLLSNGAKYSSKKENPVVEFGSFRKEGKDIYFVKDNGAGFDSGNTDRLFNVFQRFHTPEEFPGTGVGLAIVKRIIQKHGGDIWAESAPGNGAAFYFTL